MIGVFLALLELIREKKILVQQTEALGEVEIVEAPEEHKRTYAHASLHLADETTEEPLETPPTPTEEIQTTNEPDIADAGV
jgi:chromatin segregation and condensation protein Rec8/ScpA/Scc1 (kleisin family)